MRSLWSSQPEVRSNFTERRRKTLFDKIIFEKIENLFDEVKQDKSKAPLLKSELDRWNLYELYEDRFLDLFRD